MTEEINISKIPVRDISDTDKHIRLSDFTMQAHQLLNHIRELKKVGLISYIKVAQDEIMDIIKDVDRARGVLDSEQELSVETLIKISERFNTLIKTYPNIFGSISVD